MSLYLFELNEQQQKKNGGEGGGRSKLIEIRKDYKVQNKPTRKNMTSTMLLCVLFQR